MLLLFIRIRVGLYDANARRAGSSASTAVAASSIRVISIIYVYNIDASWSASATSSCISSLLNFLSLDISVYRVSLHHFDYT